LSRLWKPKISIIAAGLIFGALAAYLVKWGNPPNMGFCTACFLRDIAGSLGLQSKGPQYIRPEILGLVLGAFVAAFSFREFKSRGGSSPLLRFLLGAFMMVGALVFLGCTVRAPLRLAGGDLDAIPAIAGIIVGVIVGIFFLRRGFTLGRAAKMPAVAGWVMPVVMICLLLLAIFVPMFIFKSTSGPGALHAALWISIVVGLVIGVLAQRTRMCFAGGWRDLIMVRDTYLFSSIAAFFVAALITNYALGYVHWGFIQAGTPEATQYIAQDNHLWNFFSMVVVGLAATLLGGCPLRQTILSGEGDTDAGVTVLGMLVGAAFAHNFLTASSGKGIGVNSEAAVIIGLVFCLILGFMMREKTA
jgi:hypothetical protein